LSRSNLNGANLKFADFTGANLLDAKLRGANVKGVIWKNTNIWDIDFAGMQNVDCEKISETSSRYNSQNTLKKLRRAHC
jgi:uncharacterized protein YjbI with pentapeptide repeats